MEHPSHISADVFFILAWPWNGLPAGYAGFPRKLVTKHLAEQSQVPELPVGMGPSIGHPLIEVCSGDIAQFQAISRNRLRLLRFDEGEGREDPDVGVPKNVAVVGGTAESVRAEGHAFSFRDRTSQIEKERPDGLLVLHRTVDFDIHVPVAGPSSLGFSEKGIKLWVRSSHAFAAGPFIHVRVRRVD